MTKELKVGDWFRLRFPPDFSFKSPLCEIVETSESLQCTPEDVMVTLAGVKKAYLPGKYKLKVRNVVNRFGSSASPDPFFFETMKYGTNTVYEFYKVKGVEIKPGQVSSFTVSGNPLNKNLRIDYEITFQPMNTIPTPGKIVVSFPRDTANNYYFRLDSACRIISGLSVAPGASEISCTTSGDDITITNFNTFLS